MPTGRSLFAGQVGGYRRPSRPNRPTRSPSSPFSFTVHPKEFEFINGQAVPWDAVAGRPVDPLDYPIGPDGQPGNPDPITSRWWETPGAQFRTVTGRKGTGVRQVLLPGSNRWIDATLPDQFAGQFPDAQSFYNLYQSAGPLGLFLTANAASAESAADKAAEDVNLALTGLGGVKTQFGDALNTFRNDPRAAQVEGELMRRTSPDYRAVGELEESAVINELAQSVARATDAALNNAGFRGVSAGPGTAQRVSSIGALGEASGLQLRRGIEESNRRARSEALGQLDQFRQGRQAGELALLGALGDIERQIAAVQTGQQYVPTDFFPLAELQFGQEQFRTGQEFADRALAAEEAAAARAESELEPTFFDRLGELSSLLGTGAFEGGVGSIGPWLRYLGLWG